MTDNTKKSGIQNFTVGNTQETWVLYHNPFSLCSRKVRFCLDEYKIEYKSEPIDLIETGKYGVAEKSFLKINPDKSIIDLLRFVAMGGFLVFGGIFLNYLISKVK